MSQESANAEIRHIHKQMKAVSSLIQPEYQSLFHKMTKLLELQLLLDELTKEDSPRFQASSAASGNPKSSPCHLTDFIRAITPVCNDKERTLLKQLQNMEQTFSMMEQMRQFQNLSKDTSPENLMMQFMTPGQQKNFQQFNEYFHFSNKESNHQEVPHGSSKSSFFTGSSKSEQRD